MIGLGTIFNVITIIIGSAIGLLLKHNLKDDYKLVMLQGIGLTTMVIGIFGAVNGFLNSFDTYISLIVIVSIVLGSIIGTYLQLEKRLNNLGDKLQKRYANNNSNFAQGFVTASLIFCVGAMAIIGSINDGISGDYSILAVKAIIDGITSMILASTLGIGVMFSFIPIFLYQGLITVLAHFFGSFISEVIKTQILIVGNILIIGIGLELAEIKKIKVADMLPAIIVPILYNLIKSFFN